MDICSTKCKLEKGLKALEILDTNINLMSNWLTEMEQTLDEIENIQLSEKNIKDQIKFIKVRLNPNNFDFYCFHFMFLSILQHFAHFSQLLFYSIHTETFTFILKKNMQ